MAPYLPLERVRFKDEAYILKSDLSIDDASNRLLKTQLHHLVRRPDVA